MAPKPCIRHRCPRLAVPGRSRCTFCQTEFESQRRDDPSLTGRRGSTDWWRRLRLRIFERDGWRCTICRRHHLQLHARERLECHHLDGDANNDAENNLATVCSTCHKRLAKPGA